MRIMWLVNIPLPEVSLLMGEVERPVGGWLVNMAREISLMKGMKLTVLFPKKNIREIRKYDGERITYYGFKPVKDNNKKRIEYNKGFAELLKEEKPEIVHIHGTEFAHTLSMVNTCKEYNIRTVISIQGLVSVYSKHMFANLPWNVIYGVTLRNIIGKDNVLGLKRSFEKRGKNEIIAIKNTEHVIGRTTWDKACVSQINENAQYHFCNELLRDAFYKHHWNIDKCERYSIFFSQCSYPIKGFHFMLEAMVEIIKKYPNAKIYTTGKNPLALTFKDRLKQTYYNKYLGKLIRKYRLENNVIFLGMLNEKQMCERFLKSHIFVSASTIENSPNSVGEAMILGVPCVASDVGGVKDMLIYNEDGFIYPYDESYMISYYVCKIFADTKLTLLLSKNAKKHANLTHNISHNLERILKIYNEIVNIVTN